MTFIQIRNQVDALCRKYATELEIYRATPLALELCDEMADALTPGRPNPKLACSDWAWILFKRLRDRGIRVKGHFHLCDYLSRCLERLLLPQVNDVLRSLFPKARDQGLLPPSRIEVPFHHRRVWKPGMGYFIATLTDAALAARARSRPM